LAINHSNLFNRSKDNKADLCLRQIGSVLEHCPITGIKKIRQVAVLPKTLKRFATCLAPQQLLFSNINPLKEDLFPLGQLLTKERCFLTFEVPRVKPHGLDHMIENPRSRASRNLRSIIYLFVLANPAAELRG
jgi:hypothetical protein